MDTCHWMKTALLIFFFGGAVLAEYGWRPRLEYRFALEGKNLAGVTILNNQFAGIHYRGILNIQSQSSNVLNMVLHNVSYVKVHSELENGWWNPFLTNEENYIGLPITDTTFTLKLNKGVVEDLVLSRDLSDWEVNFIQGIVSKLQLDLSASNMIKGNKGNSIPGRGSKAPDVYSVMEDSVTGRCEVLYEVSQLPRLNDEVSQKLCGSRPFLEITKTHNHSNCEVNPEYHFGLPHTLRCQPGGNQCGQFWTRSTVSRTIGCGSREDMIFLSSTTSSRIVANLNLHNDTQASVNSFLNLTLLSTSPLSRKLTLPSNTKTIHNLMYKYTNPDIEEPSDKESPKSKKKHLDSSGSSSEEVIPEPSHKKKSKKGHHSTRPMRKSRHVPTEIDSSEKGLWNVPPKEYLLPPPRPFEGFSLAHNKGEDRACLGQQLKEMVTDIANDLESWDLTLEKSTLEKVLLAVRVCRSMTYSGLMKTIGIHMDSQLRENKILMTERKVFRDIVTMCGTNPAFQIVKTWIEEQKLKGEEAVSVISNLPSHLISPNVYVIDQFYELLRSSAVKDDFNLRSATLLAFSNLLRVACVSHNERHMRFPYHVHGESCNAEMVAKYVPYLTSQLRGDPALRPVFYVALGNTASLLALPALKLAANDPSSSPYLRARAIIAMKHLVLAEPRTMAPILLAMYDNKQSPELVRLSAISMLFFTKPPLDVWQRIALGTWYEPSGSIQTFIYTTFKSFAQSKDPNMEELSKAAAVVLKLVKPSPFPPAHHAHNYMLSGFMNQLQEILSTHVSWSNAISGTNFYMRHTGRVAGFSRVGFEADFWIANPDAFYQGLVELFYSNEDTMIARPPIEHLAHSTRWIKETLKIAPRTGPKLEGDFQFRINRLIEKMYVFNKGVVTDFFKSGKRLMDQMKNGKTFHKQSIDNVHFEMSAITDMGFPVSFHVDNPWLFSIIGGTNLSRNRTHQFNADISMIYANNLQAELSFYTPFDKTQYVAAHYSQRILKPPSTRLHAGLNSEGDGIKVSLWPLKTLETPLTIFKEINKPFTAQRDVNHFSTTGLSKNSKPVHGTFVMNKEESMKPFKLKIRRDIFESYTKMTFDPLRPFLIFGHPIVWPDLSASTIEITLDYYPPTTLEFGMGKSYTRGSDVQMVEPHHLNNLHNMTNYHMSSDDMIKSTTTETPTTMHTTLTSATTTAETSPHQHTSTTTETPTTTNTPMSTTPSTPTSTEKTEEDYDGMFAPGSEEVVKFYKTAQQPQNGNFNASIMNIAELEDNNGRIQYILRRILDGIECGNALAGGMLATIEGPAPKKYGIYWGVGNEISQRIHRAGLFFVSPAEDKSSFGITATLASPVMPVLYLSEILKENIHSNLYVDISNPRKDAFPIKGYMLRSALKPWLYEKEPAKTLLEHNYNLQPESRQLAREYTTLDLYNFTFFSNDAAHEIGDSYPVKTMKRIHFPYVSEDKVSGVNIGGRANIAMTICPEKNCIDAVMRLQDSNISFESAPVSPAFLSLILVNPVFGPFSSVVDPSFCSLEFENLVTFDGSRYDWHQYKSSHCWHVLAKDCSGMSRIAILARNYNNQTEVEVNLDNYRVLRLKHGPTAEVNGQPVAISEDLVAEVSDLKGASLMVITKSKDQAIEVRMPAHGFYMVYGNNRVMVEADRQHRGRLCGLCGDYDGEAVNDFRKPGGDVVTSSDEFSLSYAFVRSCDRDNKSE